MLDSPPPEHYTARIAVSIDGAPWIPFCDLGPSSSCGRNVQQLPGPAAAPGFHHLRFQAVVRHEDGEAETRPLPPLAYGIMGVARGTAERQDPALFVRAAASTPARSLDASLPDLKMTDWLLSLHAPGSSLEAARWESQWCGLGTRAHLSELDAHAICVAGQLQVAETKLNAEVRLRVGRLEWRDGQPLWIAENPDLDSILIRGERIAGLSSLAQLPIVLREPKDRWPQARVSVDPVDIDFMVLRSTEGAGPFLVRFRLRNDGQAHAYGVVVHLMATTGVSGSPVLQRRHVIDLPAGGSALLTERVAYPAGYGAFVVQVQSTGDGGPFSDGLDENDAWAATAFRVLNPQAAPPGFVKWFGQMLCANQCRGY